MSRSCHHVILRSETDNSPAKSRPIKRICFCVIAVLSTTLYLMLNLNNTSSTSVNSDIVELFSEDEVQFPEEPTSRDIQYLTNSSPAEVTKRNFMFIKTHKCGTSTLVDLFYLFGVRRKLNFVMFPSTHQLELLNVESRPLLPPRPGTVYNMQCQHGTFRPNIEHEIMPKETSLYSTIARSPVSQFKSAFSFFGAEGKMRKKLGPGATIDELIEKYLDSYPPPDDNHVTTSLIINSVANDLGWGTFSNGPELGGSTLQEKIEAFIKHLDSEMDFVMITDRMDESLVLLKEYLGWNITDIMYLNRMVSSKPRVSMSDKTKARILQYQVIDRQIFDHFNASFERHIDKIGREKVKALVKEFQEIRETFENKCFNKKKTVKGPYDSISWMISDYGRNVNVACTFLQTRDVILTKVITELQLSQDYTVAIDGSSNSKKYLLQEIVTKLQRDFANNADPV